ncbi:MAG: helix-turn-helix transcriptional regulator [Syntrophaceae bacterium]
MKNAISTKKKSVDELMVLQKRVSMSEKSNGKHKMIEGSFKNSMIQRDQKLNDYSQKLPLTKTHLKNEIDLRKAINHELRIYREMYESLINHIGIGVSLISPHMEILSLNKQMKKWFPNIELSKKPFCYELCNNPPKKCVCSSCPTFKTLQDGETNELITNMQMGAVIRFVRIVTNPVKDEDRRVVAVITMIEDFTREKEMHDRIMECRNQRKNCEKALITREQDLINNSRMLEEVNTALRVLVRQRDEDRIELEKKLLSNVKELVIPYIEKMKKWRLTSDEVTCLNIVEQNLNDIISPFLQNITLKHSDLTPREIQISSLVKDGKTTKEIADLLNVSIRAIEFHRDNIRIKLQLKNKKTNLRSYLLNNL